MELRQTFIHFQQMFTLLRNFRKDETSGLDKSVSDGSRRRRCRRFLKKHRAYVIAVIAGFLLSLIIARIT